MVAVDLPYATPSFIHDQKQCRAQVNDNTIKLLQVTLFILSNTNCLGCLKTKTFYYVVLSRQ